jgi:adenosylcobinamide-GDP ribazoletransferase
VNPLRLAFGTLSIYPTRPPSNVDRRVAGWAMVLAPVVAVFLAAPLWLLGELTESHCSPFLRASLCIAALGVLTRGIHLDGLADTADGLGSRKPPEAALEIMRRSDIGPFGVATIVLVLLVQVAATSQLFVRDDGPALLATALVVSRLALPFASSQGVPGARADGLGSLVAGSVGILQLLGALVVTGVCVLGIAVVDGAEEMLLAPVGLVAGLAFCWWCVRRLGGITGDVLGGCVEVTFAAALLAVAWA